MFMRGRMYDNNIIYVNCVPNNEKRQSATNEYEIVTGRALACDYKILYFIIKKYN